MRLRRLRFILLSASFLHVLGIDRASADTEIPIDPTIVPYVKFVLQMQFGPGSGQGVTNSTRYAPGLDERACLGLNEHSATVQISAPFKAKLPPFCRIRLSISYRKKECTWRSVDEERKRNNVMLFHSCLCEWSEWNNTWTIGCEEWEAFSGSNDLLR